MKKADYHDEDFHKLSDVERGLVLENARIELELRHRKEGLRCYLVSLETPEDSPVEIQESLQELASLVKTLGDSAEGVTVQKKLKVTPATYIGTGKAEEIKLACSELKIDYVAFDRELSPSQVRNLESIIERPVLDRTGIILQIFHKNAKSRTAKTQVEITRLEYLSGRLSNAWIAWERQRGGVGQKGSGESQIELDRRKIQDKIAALRKDLQKIEQEKATQRKKRTSEFKVVLVGYTNAGKTTIMNGLTEAGLSAKDALFETLDSSVRVLKGISSPKILVTDTVGFIRNLPHGLVESFHSTLEEAATADLLIHVIDLSSENFRDHIDVTNDVLQEVGASNVPRLYVFNKIDQITQNRRIAIAKTREFRNSVCLSAADDGEVNSLRHMIVNFLCSDMEERELVLNYNQTNVLNKIYEMTKVIKLDWTESGVELKIRASKKTIAYLQKLLGKETIQVEEDEGVPENPWESPWTPGDK